MCTKKKNFVQKLHLHFLYVNVQQHNHGSVALLWHNWKCECKSWTQFYCVVLVRTIVRLFLFYLKYEFSERVQKLVFWPVLAFFGHIQSKDYALPKIIGQKIQSVYEKKSYTTTLFNMSIEEWAVFFSLPTAELFCSVSAWWYLVQALFNFEGPIDFHKRFLVYIRASGQKKVYMHLWSYTWF